MPRAGEGKQEQHLNNETDHEVELTLVFFLTGILSSAQTQRRSRAACFAKQTIDKNPFTLLRVGNRQRWIGVATILQRSDRTDAEKRRQTKTTARSSLPVKVAALQWIALAQTSDQRNTDMSCQILRKISQKYSRDMSDSLWNCRDLNDKTDMRQSVGTVSLASCKHFTLYITEILQIMCVLPCKYPSTTIMSKITSWRGLQTWHTDAS